MTIVEFLRARLDEDERAAQMAARFHPAPWRLDPEVQTTMELGRWVADAAEEGVLVANGDGPAHLIARYDPARVLAEVEAKRRIIADYEAVSDNPSWQGVTTSYHWANALLPVLRLFALPYRDHPGYLAEWAP